MNRKRKFIQNNDLFRLLFIGFFILLAFYYLPKIQIDNSIERWLPPYAKELAEYESFLNTFGSDALLIVAFDDPSGSASQQNEEYINEFQKQVIQLENVTTVVRWPVAPFRLKKQMNKNIYSILIGFTPPSYLNPNRPVLLEQIEALLESIPIKSHLAGTGVIHKAINVQTNKSTSQFLFLGLLVLIFTLWFLLRNFSALIATVLIAGGGLSSMLIASVFFDIPLSMITVILPLIILFYATSNTLHIFYHQGDFRIVLAPCFMATFASSLGFMAFWFDPIPKMQDFAILANAGLWGNLLWTIIIFYPHRSKFKSNRLLEKYFSRFDIASKLKYIILLLLSLPIFFYGIFQIKAEIFSLSVLSAEDKAVVDHHYIEKNIGNYIPLEFTVNLDSVSSTSVIKWMDEVLELEEVDGALSYLDFSGFRNPAENGYLSFKKRMGRITFLMPLVSSIEGIRLLAGIEQIARKHFKKSNPKITGYVTLYGRVADTLGKSFIENLLWAFTIVFTFLFIYLRNIRVFAVTILPNIIPILIIIGLMGLLKIPLDMVTVPIGCLLLGIVVDDTIHILYWHKRTKDTNIAVKEAGPAILSTTVILILGFSVLLLSEAPPIVNFGLLSITALSTALLGDLLLLPYFMRLLKTGHNS